MTATAAFLDRCTTWLERASSLDGPADILQAVTARLPSGGVKDALSGTLVGHPLHPVLVTLPIGAFSSALLVDALGNDPKTARRLVGAGLLTSVPAAAAGLTDWNDTTGAERRVGLAHAAVNLVGLGLLAASWVARQQKDSGRTLALAGFGMLGASSWLGGHLAYALGVGVDTTSFQRPPTEWTEVCREEQLVDGIPHSVTIDAFPILLIREGAAIHAIGDRCTHRGAPLHEGQVSDGCVTCPWHGSRFELADGSVSRGPATRPAPTLAARVVDGKVEVRRDEVRSLRLNPTT